MKPISIGNFEGFESLPGLFGEPAKSDAEGFGEMLDSFAGIMPVVPVAPPAQLTTPVKTENATVNSVLSGADLSGLTSDPNALSAMPTVTATGDNGGKTRGLNQNIEQLTAQINFDKAPTGVSQAPDDPATPAPGPRQILGTKRLELEFETRRNTTMPTFPSRTGGIKTPPEDTKVVKTPDIIVMPGDEKTKKDPIIVRTPDIIVMPGSEKVKDLPPLGTQSPDIIVMPGGDKTKDLPVVSQDSPDILVLPERSHPETSVKPPASVLKTPEIAVQPMRPAMADAGGPDAATNTILGLPESNPGQLSSDAGLGGARGATVTGSDRSMLNNTMTTNSAEGFDQLFDPTGVTITPQMRDGRLKGFDLLPADVKALVEKFEPMLRDSNAVGQNPAGLTAPANAATTFVNGNSEPVTFSNLSRFWVKTDAEKAAANDARPDGATARISSFSNSSQNLTVGLTDAAQTPTPGAGKTVSSFLPDADSAGLSTLRTSFEDRAEPNLNRDLGDAVQPDQPGGVKFEQMLANVDSENTVKPAPANDSLRNGLVADQVNPHLLELASMAARKNEKQTMKMRLHPAELGTVEIQLERAENGLLNASFQTETAGARDALSNNLEQLRESLQQAGWQVGSMDVSTESRGSQREPQRDPGQPLTRFDSLVNGLEMQNAAATAGETQKNSPNRLLSLIA